MTKEDVSNWETVETFVCTFAAGQFSDDPDGACDVEVQIGSETLTLDTVWYLRTRDDAGGSDDCGDTAYDTESEARAAAEEFAAANNEAEAGEDASDYLARRATETTDDD